MIKVLVVEDSPVVQEFLVYLLSSDPEIQVIGTATNGEEALEAVEQKKPDVITMDIHMPRMNGIEATRRIMETHPTPIIIVSSSENLKEVATTFQAMEAGALAVISRPKGIGHPNQITSAKELIRTVKLMSEVKVVRRWVRSGTIPVVPSVIKEQEKKLRKRIGVIAIGASTGGPVILQTILAGFPKDFPVSVLIVQHIASGFMRGFVDWLAQSTGFPIHVAVHGEILSFGHAYVAPEGSQMGVSPDNRILLSQCGPLGGLNPSISYLFRSVSEVYGSNAAGILLTGMGKDGAEELKLMKEKGALTIVQDEASSIVFGMPGEAIKLGAATYVLSPEKIVSLIIDLMK
jgi:two-component system chemotaxis response regulator CheB